MDDVSFEQPTICNDCGECWDEAGWVSCPRCQVTSLRADLARVTAECEEALAIGYAEVAARIVACAERDVWQRTCADLRVQESQVAGALADAGDVPTSPVEGVRALVRQRDEARAALSGRTVSCVCGAEAERDRMRAVVEAARVWLVEFDGPEDMVSLHEERLFDSFRAALAALDGEEKR
jgi:hypothetical protein